jgi:cold shock CspA family protein
MRTHGTLTKWNDDRGFGFITQAKGGADLFVHISAFPRDGVRPRLNELISFEVETASDGKRRAVRVMRAGQRPPGRSAPVREHRGAQNRWVNGLLTVVVIAGLAAYGYSQYKKRVAYVPPAASRTSISSESLPNSCDGRTICSQMTSCAEATYFIRNCPNTQMDGDGDGVPCESQWCK